jgi:methylmalonyl-CoA/ethylmalonyl-CoA epimerase
MRLDHIAIAVSDLDAAETAYKALGLPWKGREEVPDQKVLTSLFQSGDSRVELITPTADDSPIAGFLAKKGSGLHHICFEVPDIEAEITRLKSEGFRLLNETPRPGIEGSRVVFLHPASAAGVLVELVEKETGK